MNINKGKIIKLSILWIMVVIICMSFAKNANKARAVKDSSHVVYANVTDILSNDFVFQDESGADSSSSGYDVYLVQTLKISYSDGGQEYERQFQGSMIRCCSTNIRSLTRTEQKKYVKEKGKALGDIVPIYVGNSEPSKAYLKSEIDNQMSSYKYITNVIIVCIPALFISALIVMKKNKYVSS